MFLVFPPVWLVSSFLAGTEHIKGSSREQEEEIREHGLLAPVSAPPTLPLTHLIRRAFNFIPLGALFRSSPLPEAKNSLRTMAKKAACWALAAAVVAVDGYAFAPSTSFSLAVRSSGSITTLRPACARLRLRMQFDQADELHAAGQIREAIDALGAMEGSGAYVRRSRWTVDLSENETDKEAKLKVLKGAEADALKAVELDGDNFAAWKAAAIVKGKMQKCVGTNEKVALTKVNCVR